MRGRDKYPNSSFSYTFQWVNLVRSQLAGESGGCHLPSKDVEKNRERNRCDNKEKADDQDSGCSKADSRSQPAGGLLLERVGRFQMLMVRGSLATLAGSGRP